ncbi:MAG: hypothetical protein J3K34DRAFT_518253 [Monoraphidium minutum]|nr:MAG: hypothetical protein J3K34DRAFT_518253 [Monoraphidium minutum]
MQGLLFRYGPAAPQIALRSGGSSGGAAPHARHLVLVHGLTEGLLFAPYAQQLAAGAERAGYALVQAQLRSSYQGWGVGCLDEDADDLLALSRHLRGELGSRGIVLMGHSTGCQARDVVRFCARHGAAEGAAPLEGVILQAPVSDREWLSHCHPGVVALLPAAKAMAAEGRGAEVAARAPADLDAAPVSAARLVALVERLGDDDMWSMDLTPGELRRLLGHLAPWPLLLLQSGADESVPDPASIPELGRRVMAAVGGGGGGAAAGEGGGGGGGGAGLRRHVVLDRAPHNAAGHEEALAAAVEEFLVSVRAGNT